MNCLLNIFKIANLEEVVVKSGFMENPDIRWFLVSVQENFHHICTGSVLTSSLVLVAAHCVCLPNITTAKPASDLQVLHGVNGSVYGKAASVQSILVHPKYKTPWNLRYDVALLRVSLKDLPTNDGSPWGKLPPQNWPCLTIGLREATPSQEHLEMLIAKNILIKRSQCYNALHLLKIRVTDMNACTKGECVNDKGALLLCNGVHVGVRTSSACVKDNITVWTRLDVLPFLSGNTFRSIKSRSNYILRSYDYYKFMESEQNKTHYLGNNTPALLGIILGTSFYFTATISLFVVLIIILRQLYRTGRWGFWC